MSRGGDTQVRVYQGEVEHFVSAQNEGIGVRVIRDGRTGFAYAGTLDPGAVDEVLAEARDNVVFGTVDDWAGLAEPDGVERTPQELWNDALADFPTEQKIELAKELERLTLGVDARVRVDDANYADAWGEVAVATTTAFARPVARTGATSASAALPTTATRRRPASGSAWRASRVASTSPRRRERPPIAPPDSSARRSHRASD